MGQHTIGHTLSLNFNQIDNSQWRNSVNINWTTGLGFIAIAGSTVV